MGAGDQERLGRAAVRVTCCPQRSVAQTMTYLSSRAKLSLPWLLPDCTRRLALAAPHSSIKSRNLERWQSLVIGVFFFSALLSSEPCPERKLTLGQTTFHL